ncbi:D-lactate dehydrogenase [Fibrisoma limi BUZ 3]|uniref:D-lactate dehydrogenase n=1 Tax=Fibrisoma limi BUZ 3 TaxID=1185876 RepID=I2GFG4_9BACT|nr:2-hydroxyacid dehydrogenase [Fibrisoma limi]CCH52639.1 D-lactate dehydrogenase [Fibrisoma limi BUZ 3]
MRIAFFNTKPYERHWFEQYQGHHQISFFEEPLTSFHAELASGHQAVCAFVNDNLSKLTLKALKEAGVSLVAMRCAGLDNVDLEAADHLGMTVINVPDYSPFAVAEHGVALLLGLMRHLTEANKRVEAGNFSINGLVGTELHGKTVGVVGTGHIGRAFCQIMTGFGCRVIAYDIKPTAQLMRMGVQYVSLDDLLMQADVLALHCPLTAATKGMIDAEAIARMKPTAMLINTSRGKVVDTNAVLAALNQDQLAGYGADVYEQEANWFGRDWAQEGVGDELLNRLRSHPRVLLTAHQGFLTEEALCQIARSLLNKLSFYEGRQLEGITHASMC